MTDRESHLLNLLAISKSFDEHVKGLHKKTLRPLFDALYPKLEKAISRGMTQVQISAWIKQNAGVECSPRTVQRYLTQKRKAKQQRMSNRTKVKPTSVKTHKFNTIRDREL